MKDFISKLIENSDILIEVLDSRFPRDCRLYDLEEKINKMNKKIILVLNKADLVPKNFLYKVYKEFSNEYDTVYVSSVERRGSRKLREKIKEIGRKIDKDKIYISVFGYPNVGKSSIINLLIGKGKAGVSPRPGFTRGIQLIKLSRKYYLIDSPGIILPKNKYFLCILGGISPEKLDHPEKALYYLYKKLDKKFFIETYDINFSNFREFLFSLKNRFNIMEKDWIKKVSLKVLYDWQKGNLSGYWY